MNYKPLSSILTLFLSLQSLQAEAQSLGPEYSHLQGSMKRSESVTRGQSIRQTVVNETSNRPDGEWKHYSSWIVEAVFPDRSYLSYKSLRFGEFIRIGDTLYSKEIYGGPWVRSLKDDRSFLVPKNPGKVRGWRGPFYEVSLSYESKGVKVFMVVSKPKPDAEANAIQTYAYYFSDQGILFKEQSIAYHVSDFVRRTETYEYNMDLKIEAPVQ